MKKLLAVIAVFALVATGQAVFAAKTAPIFTTAKVLKVQGEVKVRATEKDAPVDAKVGESYPAGTIITTGRASLIDFEFSPKNKFRILANSHVVIQPDTKNPKLVALNMSQGEIESTLGELSIQMKNMVFHQNLHNMVFHQNLYNL